MSKCLRVSESVSGGGYYVLFSVYRLFGKNLLIFIAAFILDVGRVIFSRGGVQNWGFFIYNVLIEISNKLLWIKTAGFCIFS